MAERRMFSKTIVDSDCFLDLPIAAQNLYFHLAMRADDDGFINNPKSIMRNVCCNQDDLNTLISKKFIIAFESGVVAVRHWRVHNYIQKDRYKPTSCQEEKSRLKLEENNVYTECIQNVSKTDTQVRLGEDSSGKVSSEGEKEENPTAPPQKNKSEIGFNKYGEYSHVLLTCEQYSALVKDFGKKTAKEYIKKVDEYCQQNGKIYNDFNLTIRKWIEEDKQNTNRITESSFDLNEFEEFALNNVPKISVNSQKESDKQIRYGNYI